MLDPETVKKAITAMKEGDGDGALALLESMVAEAAGGDAEDAPDETPAMNDTPDEEDDPEAMNDTPDEEEDEDVAAAVAAASRLQRITGKSSIGAAVAEAEVWRESHIALETERQKLEKDRQKIELADRRKLVAELVKLGAETPATAWQGEPKKLIPCKRLADEPLGGLRERVASLAKARGKVVELRPPTAGAGGDDANEETDENGLTARELEKCRAKKVDPKEYARLKKGIDERRPKARSTG